MLGTWEITVEPLADGNYDLTVEIEDLAGNITMVDPIFNAFDATIDIEIDTVIAQHAVPGSGRGQ